MDLIFYIICAIFIITPITLITLAIRELICVWRNPFPLFPNGDKKFSEVIRSYKGNLKTRSILEDIGYKESTL